MGHDNHYIYLNRFIKMKDIDEKLNKIGKTKLRYYFEKYLIKFGFNKILNYLYKNKNN